jgi:hypothetical protein
MYNGGAGRGGNTQMPFEPEMVVSRHQYVCRTMGKPEGGYGDGPRLEGEFHEHFSVAGGVSDYVVDSTLDGGSTAGGGMQRAARGRMPTGGFADERHRHTGKPLP